MNNHKHIERVTTRNIVFLFGRLLLVLLRGIGVRPSVGDGHAQFVVRGHPQIPSTCQTLKLSVVAPDPLDGGDPPESPPQVPMVGGAFRAQE